jgi:hypothetical protein
MNKSILVAAIILALAVMACGFGGAAPTPTPIIEIVTATPLPPTVQPTQQVVQPTQPPVQPTQPVVQPTQSSGSSSSGLPFSDDFTNPNSGWEAGTYADGSVGYGNGYYFVNVTTKNSDLYGAATLDGISDSVLSVDAAQFTGPSDNNTAYGAICRLQNDSTNDGYYFRITGDGQFSVVKYANNSFTSLLPGTDEWQDAPSVNLGNVSNHIVITCNGTHLTFTVNGTTLFDGTDNTFSSGGFGLLGVVFEDNATAEFHFTSFQAKAP